ncbi:MAG: hypothetical protein R3E66_18345, partial [bacterium]
MKRLHTLIFVCALCACSESTEETVTACDDGQTRNPITGLCAAPNATSNNTTGNTNAADSGMAVDMPGAADVGMDTAETPDAATQPDMAIDPPDMGKPVEDLIRFVAIGDT